MSQATYAVQPGDTYYTIAQGLQNITSQMLENANSNYPPANLQAGVPSNIPINTANATYVVQPGDTYYTIAQGLQNTTTQVLEDANSNYPAANLQAGVQINIPV